MTDVLVSVLIPTYNRALTVDATLNSVFDQKHRPIEIIVVDDGSTDNTLDVIYQWQKDHADDHLSLRVFPRSNKGAPAARNFALDKATGKYLNFLDSDDTIEKDKISAQTVALERGIADVAVCDFQCVDPSRGLKRPELNSGNLHKRLAKGWSLSVSTPLIRASVIKGNIYWDESLSRQQDVDFLFKVMMLTDRYVYTPGVWCNYIKHGGAQISDQYGVKPPQFLRRVISLVSFLWSERSRLSRQRKIFVIHGITTLLMQASRRLAYSGASLAIGEANASRLKLLIKHWTTKVRSGS